MKIPRERKMKIFKSENDLFLAVSSNDEDRLRLSRAGWQWTQNGALTCWSTPSPKLVCNFLEYADDEVREEILDFMKFEDDSLALSNTKDSDFYIPAPKGRSYLPFQKAGIEYASMRPNTLMADDMGLGKTIQAIGLINLDRKIKSVLVISPASLRLNWKNEFNDWLVRPKSIEIVVPPNPFPDARVVIINYDILHKYELDIRNRHWDLLIVDEAHYLKNASSRRSKQVLGIKMATRDKYRLSPIEARKLIFLTGTPMVNRPADLWPLINRLDPKSWHHPAGFAQRYCGVKVLKGGMDYSGASNLDELQTRLRQTVMLRRLKSDVLKDLPGKLRQIILISPDSAADQVNLENAAYQKYQDISKSLTHLTQMAKIPLDKRSFREEVAKLSKSKKLAWSELATARQETALAKLPHVLEHLGNVSGKVVLFAHHKRVIQQLKENLKHEAVVLHGGTPSGLRQALVERFQKDSKIKIFIGSLQAAGVGLTLTASSHVIFAELDWVPSNVMQAEDRCHRIGQKNSVLVQHLVFDGSVDANMAKTIVNKQKIIEQALNYDEDINSL